ncbi:hypothetical protein [Bacillus phage SBSphiJ2]|nr:hypothetical protein [Bacillus phage SBSphiJ2]
MIELKISAKELTPGVKYAKPITEFTLGGDAYGDALREKVLFTAETLKKEVMQGAERQRLKKVKKLKKLLKVSLTVFGVGLKMSPAAMAATTATAPITNSITPAMVMSWGLNLALISVSVGVALSMTLLTLAGIYRMMRKRKEAEEWSVDVIKGLVQVLVAVPVVYLLFYLAQTVFKSLPILSGLF